MCKINMCQTTRSTSQPNLPPSACPSQVRAAHIHSLLPGAQPQNLGVVGGSPLPPPSHLSPATLNSLMHCQQMLLILHQNVSRTQFILTTSILDPGPHHLSHPNQYKSILPAPPASTLTAYSPFPSEQPEGALYY